MSHNAKRRKQNFSEEFPTDWDLDYYRTDHESEEHWNLRRRFMEVHKNKFPEDRLVCLAQVFTNVEFMGCKYPAETMRLVGELSQVVAAGFRAERANRLKRTFVTASDAAEMRAKGRRSQKGAQQQQINNQQDEFNRHTGLGNRNKVQQRDLFEGLPFGRFVFLVHYGNNSLQISAQRCNMLYQLVEEVEGNMYKVKVFLDQKLVTSAKATNLKETKATANTKAAEILRKKCYSIRSNPNRDFIKVDKVKNQIVCQANKSEEEDGPEPNNDIANNKGYKMMKMMGWTGGGLGSKSQGRLEPVGYLLKNNRIGLGNQGTRLDCSNFENMLKNYINSEDIRVLRFEPSFTKEERARLHDIAGRFDLKSKSTGKNENRRLEISKKNISDLKILEEVLLNNNKTFTDQYEVQVPESKAALFPENTTHLTFIANVQ